MVLRQTQRTRKNVSRNRKSSRSAVTSFTLAARLRKAEPSNEAAVSAGYTPMGHAVLTGNVEQVRFLIEQGVDIYQPVHLVHISMTVLRIAEIYDRVEVVEALCQLGLDPSAKQADGNTELHSLVGFSPSINRLIVAAARDLEARNALGITALQYAAWCNREAVVRALLDGGSDIEARDERGCTALMYVASRGNSELVSCLLARHADVHACDNNGKSALYYATQYGTSDTAHILVRAGAASSKCRGCGGTRV